MIFENLNETSGSFRMDITKKPNLSPYFYMIALLSPKVVASPKTYLHLLGLKSAILRG